MEKQTGKICVLTMIGGVLVAQNAFATTSSKVLVYSNQLAKIAMDLTTGQLPSALAIIALGVGCLMHFLGKDQQIVHVLANVVMILGALVAAPSILTSLGLYSATL